METIISVGPAGNQAVAVLGRVAWMAVTREPGPGLPRTGKTRNAGSLRGSSRGLGGRGRRHPDPDRHQATDG